MNDLQKFKEKFDPYLKRFLEQKIDSLSKYSTDIYISGYINYVKKIALMGGKRIRPYIAYLSYFAFGGKEVEKALKILVSLEIFHLFALIHDDIMDKDNMRHNLQTSHSYIADKLKKERGNKNYKHAGNSQAILLGDLFFNWSAEIINLNLDSDQTIMQRIRQLFFDMVDGTIIGQMLDIDSQSRHKITPTLNSKINYLKTARYSFIYPLLIGASLAIKIDKDIEEMLEELGLNLGMAFQAQDDIFDVTQNAVDIKQNKKVIENNFNQAINLVSKLPIKENVKSTFLNLIEIIEKRSF